MITRGSGVRAWVILSGEPLTPSEGLDEDNEGVAYVAMAPHSSTLAWKIPWTEEPGRLQSMGSLRVGHDWVNSLSLFTFMHWRRKWEPTPVFLPENPRDGGAWWAAVYGVAQSRTRLKWLSSSSSTCGKGIEMIHVNNVLGNNCSSGVRGGHWEGGTSSWAVSWTQTLGGSFLPSLFLECVFLPLFPHTSCFKDTALREQLLLTPCELTTWLYVNS